MANTSKPTILIRRIGVRSGNNFCWPSILSFYYYVHCSSPLIPLMIRDYYTALYYWTALNRLALRQTRIQELSHHVRTASCYIADMIEPVSVDDSATTTYRMLRCGATGSSPRSGPCNSHRRCRGGRTLI